MKKQDAKVLSRKQKFLRSLLRIFGMVIFIVLGIYLWNPQRVHFGEPRKMPPINHGITESNFIKRDTRITVVVGHPDDAEFFVSGTLLKLHEAGAKITLILVTDGDKGYYPFFLTNAEENRRIRRQEQRDASAAYGAELVFLGGADGRYNPDETELRAKLLEAMKASKPDYILTFDSECLPQIQHRDHENLGRAASELAKETSAKALLLFATTSPNFTVDTSKYWPTREKLLAVHKSQFYDDKLEMIKGMVHTRTIEAAEDTNFELGEAYRVVPL